MNIEIADQALAEVLAHHPPEQQSNFLLFGELVSSGFDERLARRIVRASEAEHHAVARFHAWWRATPAAWDLGPGFAASIFLTGAGLDDESVEAWVALIACRAHQEHGEPAAAGARVCRVCGCRDGRACAGGCAWVERDLCSACVESGAV
jgi:hypothetical protein